MSFFDWFKKKCRVVVVEESILSDVREELEKLLECWRREGANKIVVFRCPGGAGNSPVPIRNFLRKMDKRYILQGVMILGELPVAFFDETYASRDILYTSDYFFMELKGSWTLAEKNIVSTSQKRSPEICAGRVFIGEQTGISSKRPPVSEYYKRAIRKMREYRLRGGAMNSDSKAVVVSNLGQVNVYKSHLSNLYPSAVIDTFDGTTDVEYKAIIETDYNWILYYGHSDPVQHTMANGTTWDQFDYHESEINIDIFQFESCATGNIAWHTNSDSSDPSSPIVAKAASDSFISNILGNEKKGVLVLAPSIPGFFDDMDRFYGYLRSGNTFGNAFKKWMNREIEENEPHYMSLYGDPFIKLRVNPDAYKKKRSWWENLMDRILGRGIQYL
jgi:hypothetical protein